MAKKKKQTQAQMLLSPESYIRQKARNLPIYKCWVNEDWEDCRLAHIFIARQHTSGNVTFCVYLVDLGCLGVKDTSYGFNISLEELEGMIMRIEEDIEIDDTLSYSLAHNIIYSAIEFAEEYGFKPHRDFTQITQFFLEEDTDEIPLIAVECGHIEDGKPSYINTGYESPAKTKQIIAQLNKTAGEGNYHVLIDVDGYDDDDEFEDKYDDEDDEFDEFDEVCQLSKEEQETLFFELLHREDEAVTQEGVRKMIMLTPLLANNYTDEEAAEKYREELAQALDHPTTKPDELPNSLFSEEYLIKYYKEFVNIENIADNPADTLARNAAFEKYLSSFENESENFVNRLNPFLFTTKMSALSCILEQQKNK